MNMKKNLLFGFLTILTSIVIMISCQKDPPTADFSYVVDGLTVTFTSVVTNTDSYSWDFGDNETSTEADPVHVFEAAGDFDVTLTAKGEGGSDEVEKTVTVTISLNDVKNFLTGGSDNANGKTWVLDRIVHVGVDGGSAVEPTMFLAIGIDPVAMDTILDSEYDNEFTFYYNGNYEVDLVNDTAVLATLFGIYGGEVQLYTMENNLYGLNKSSYTAPESSTWTLHEDDLVVDAITNPLGIEVPAIHGNITFSDKFWVDLSDGAYFGILDFPTTRQFIVKSISNESMSVALFICSYWLDPTGSGNLPTWLYHLTFIPKQ